MTALTPHRAPSGSQPGEAREDLGEGRARVARAQNGQFGGELLKRRREVGRRDPLAVLDLQRQPRRLGGRRHDELLAFEADRGPEPGRVLPGQGRGDVQDVRLLGRDVRREGLEFEDRRRGPALGGLGLCFGLDEPVGVAPGLGGLGGFGGVLGGFERVLADLLVVGDLQVVEGPGEGGVVVDLGGERNPGELRHPEKTAERDARPRRRADGGGVRGRGRRTAVAPGIT